MRKILLVLSLTCYLFGNSDVYSSDVKPVFADAKSKKAIGKLLPSNAVKILAEDGDRVKILVKGFLNPAAANVIYFSDTHRIFTLAFAKTANVDIKVTKKGQDGKWDSVETIVYTTKGGFENNVDDMFKRASDLYVNNCGSCHALPDIKQHKPNQWPSVLRSMLSRTAIEKKDEWLITEYLQKSSANAK